MLEKIEQYAKEYYVPIMQKEGIEFVQRFIKDNQVKTILEIGSAIGYSAIQMALVSPDIRVVTIERDVERYKEAIKNIELLGLEKQIEIYLIDAFDFETNMQFDMMLIDAAKSQNEKFFQKFEKNIRKFILTDNLNFHGLVYHDEEIKSKNVRGMVRKIEQYIDFLKRNPHFDTTVYNVGDGIGVSIRKES